ncbi:hypothetical protein Mesil_1908 [Allomeiothermus silvanus DSM 9946]|uniref:Uncharacterized protein n=1 Tax=Allomeiothermus silvanus (strain ATCC 700542 / DSM 9946 / NBRC 106475 / NCIMB 13440 / VI-R2) TaxID=526227 RepID=D7BGG7_ALLS1|nr:hypothetical protein [Allomeiothermus silvanus]ADH63783.1 hypothetical protein Mesil_1908 [Allomeiothermus silvanus DSM 9946]
MIFDKKNPRRAALIRGRILEVIYFAAMGDALNPDDPYSMSRGVLQAALEQLNELPAETDLHAALRYCAEKGYLEVAWRKDGSGSFDSVRLTTAGIDLYEGSIHDKAVYFHSRR